LLPVDNRLSLQRTLLPAWQPKVSAVRKEHSRGVRQDVGFLADNAPDPEPSTDSILVLGLVGLVCLVLVAAAVTVVVLVLRRRR